MPLNPLFTFDELPTTSGAAIREFNDRYLAAIGMATPTGWADTLGDLIPTNAPLVTFPISQLRTQYKRTEGESRFKKLAEVSFDVKTEEFDDGYQAKLSDLFQKVFAYRNWQRAPGRLVLAEEQFRHTQIAALLTAATGTLGVDGVNFFGAGHPANMTDATIAGTWSNYNSVATNVMGLAATGNNAGTQDLTALQQEVIAMQTTVLDENGNLLGANPDTILVPSDYYEPLKNLLAKDLILQAVTQGGNNVGAAATNNPYKGRFNVVPVKEFPLNTGSTADWYLVDSTLVSKDGVSPWVALRQTMPQSLALRVYDEASDFFKDTGDIKLTSHIWYGFGLAFPHAIRRVKGPTR